MDSCLGTLSKYFLCITNSLVFGLGVAILGCGIWALVAKPSFIGILDDAHVLCGEGDTSCAAILSTFPFFSSATYIIIVIAALVILISFFGCCGAMKESKCLLGTYFTIVLALFIAMLIGAILGYSGTLEDNSKVLFEKILKKYDDQPADEDQIAQAYKSAWNEMQKELKCCGLYSFKDWQNTSGADFHFPGSFNKPEGCCVFSRESGDELTPAQVKDCREANPNDNGTKAGYYLNGCFPYYKDQIESNKDAVVGLTTAGVAVTFLNILISFALCMTVKS